MPNWCYNSLIVSGNKEELADFVSKTIIPVNTSSEEEYDETQRFTFSILHPIPLPLKGDYSPLPKLENETEDEFKARMNENKRLYGAKDWYDWSINNWGTKWDCSSTIVNELTENILKVNFNTAWSPPISWFEKVIPMYPQLEFTLIFDEEGDSFCGKLTGINGEIVEIEDDEPYYIDEDENEVIYDNGKHKWKYKDTDILIEDEDFYPISVNPFF